MIGHPDSRSHLVAISRRDPDSSVTPAITIESILVAHLLIMLLRRVRTGTDLSEMYITMPELKSDLAAVSRARAWADPEDIATKVIYHTVGLKITRIDRRGKHGAKVRFTGL